MNDENLLARVALSLQVSTSNGQEPEMQFRELRGHLLPTFMLFFGRNWMCE